MIRRDVRAIRSYARTIEARLRKEHAAELTSQTDFPNLPPYRAEEGTEEMIRDLGEVIRILDRWEKR